MSEPERLRDDTTLPLASLTFERVSIRIDPPYYLAVVLKSSGHYLNTHSRLTDDSLGGRHILPGDLLIFDYDRTTPEDGVIMLVQDGAEYVARVCRVLADGRVEFHPAAPGYPILNGERRISGTLAAVVRATDGRVQG
jgi:hypothetical protein